MFLNGSPAMNGVSSEGREFKEDASDACRNLVA
jgi:hypothetical protein